MSDWNYPTIFTRKYPQHMISDECVDYKYAMHTVEWDQALNLTGLLIVHNLKLICQLLVCNQQCNGDARGPGERSIAHPGHEPGSMGWEPIPNENLRRLLCYNNEAINNEETEELIRYAALIHNSAMTATLKVTPTLISNHFEKHTLLLWWKYLNLFINIQGFNLK
jgi:hypothetical protein